MLVRCRLLESQYALCVLRDTFVVVFFLVRLFCLSVFLFVVFLLCIFCVVRLGDFLLVCYVFFVLGLEISFPACCFPCLSFHLLIALDILHYCACLIVHGFCR